MPKPKPPSPRQPVQIDAAQMEQLRALGEARGGIPVTRLVRTAIAEYLVRAQKAGRK
jgi:hypothetical protein